VTAVLAVEVTPRALAQLERAAEWWAVHRPAAPGAIADDFEAAAKLLMLQPGIGERSASPRYPELRSLQLDRVRYDIYYHVLPGKVVVLAFWHSNRGSAPKL
jgi:plasmid stabilization system protein ParE